MKFALAWKLVPLPYHMGRVRHITSNAEPLVGPVSIHTLTERFKHFLEVSNPQLVQYHVDVLTY